MIGGGRPLLPEILGQTDRVGANIEKWGSCLKQLNIVIFRNNSTELGYKVCMFLYSRCIKFHAAICMHC